LTPTRSESTLYVVEESRKILIVADSEESTQKLATGIAAIIVPPSFDDYSVSILKSDTFYGTDILPVHAFFIGCDLPSPLSFTYVEILFERINLAGRPCGIFSSNPKALRYLSRLMYDSEASVGKPLLAKNGGIDQTKLGEWVKSIIEIRG